jgi:alkylation response protein AidB-like acyl-CoA dehydrogenase
MNLSFSAGDEAFRAEVRTWLQEHMVGDFARIRGRGGLGDMDAFVPERIAWERELAGGGWTCLGWPTEHGGRGATLFEEVIFYEEYARAGAPGRVGHVGEHLLGPTVIAHGSDAQKARFLPGIVAGTELWCQGYSEPNAGSDLANLSTRAELRDGRWHITGQKVWTSLAEQSQWCFALCRTDPAPAKKHHGITCLLVPMDQPGVSVVPIRQITGSSEFAEVFFEDAVTDADNIVGPVGGGWRVAMGTLAVERGASTLGQQLAFVAEFDRVVAVARDTGAAKDPLIRDRIGDLAMRLKVMRLNAMRTLSAHAADRELPREASIVKLYWASWHRDLGELAMDVLGAAAAHCDPAYEDLHRLFLWTRSDTIYAGTNQIQRNLIAQRALGMPR